MTMLGNLFRYASTIYFATLATSLVTFVVTLLIPKIISVEALGKYALFLMIMSVGGTIAGFGLNRSIVKYIGEGNVSRKWLMSLVVLLVLVVAFLTVLICVLGWNRLGPVYSLGIVCIGPHMMIDLSCAFFRGRFEQRKEAILLIVTSFLNSLIIISFLVARRDELAPIYGSAISYGVSMIGLLLYFYFREDVHIKHIWSKHLKKLPFNDLAAFSRPLWFASIIGVISQGADRFVLEAVVGYAALGEYFLALRFFDLVERPLGIYSKALLAGFSIEKENSLSNYRNIIWINLIVMPAVVLLMVGVVPIFVRLFFQDPYTNVAFLFAIIASSIVFKSVEVVNNVMTIAHDYPVANQQKQLFSFLLSLPIMILLIKVFGTYGAATSFLVYWFLSTFIHIYFMRRRLPEFVAFSTIRLVKSFVVFVTATALICGLEWYMWSFLFSFLYILIGSFLHIWNLKDAKLVMLNMVSSLSMRTNKG